MSSSKQIRVTRHVLLKVFKENQKNLKKPFKKKVPCTFNIVFLNSDPVSCLIFLSFLNTFSSHVYTIVLVEWENPPYAINSSEYGYACPEGYTIIESKGVCVEAKDYLDSTGALPATFGSGTSQYDGGIYGSITDHSDPFGCFTAHQGMTDVLHNLAGTTDPIRQHRHIICKLIVEQSGKHILFNFLKFHYRIFQPN